MDKKSNVGGQAVIEGVMMRGKKGIAIAVRKTNGKINVKFEEKTPLLSGNKFLKLPFIRGGVNLFDSMIIGIKSLNHSASFFEEYDTEPSKFEDFLRSVFKEKSNDAFIFMTVSLSLVISILIFFMLPTLGANVLKLINVNNPIILNLFEGIIRITIFFVYIYLIGKLEDVQRVFEYHGAEHKTIFAYENKVELTPENVKKFPRLHPRCGTNFMFLVMIVSIILFSFTGWNSLLQRVLYRIVLLPVVAGVTYEIIRWLGKNEGKLASTIAYPGLMLQKFTTREPDDEQIQVAIASLLVAEGLKKAEEYDNEEIEEIEETKINHEE